MNNFIRYWANGVFYFIAITSGYGLARLFSYESSVYDIKYYGMGFAFIMMSRVLIFTRIKPYGFFYYLIIFINLIAVIISISSTSFSLSYNLSSIIGQQNIYLSTIILTASIIFLLITSIYYLNKI